MENTPVMKDNLTPTYKYVHCFKVLKTLTPILLIPPCLDHFTMIGQTRVDIYILSECSLA